MHCQLFSPRIAHSRMIGTKFLNIGLDSLYMVEMAETCCTVQNKTPRITATGVYVQFHIGYPAAHSMYEIVIERRLCGNPT